MELAGETGSRFWLTLASAFLASVEVESGDLPEAEHVLGLVLAAETSTRSVAQRMAWCARAELALAQHDARLALKICARLITTAPDTQHGSPRLLLLRGEALLALKQSAEAEIVLQTAQEVAREQDQRSLLWRIHLLRGKLFSGSRRHEEAEQAFFSARELVEELAASLADETLRARFVSQASTLLAPARPLTARRAEKLAFEGLTAREREIALLVAQGKYNREIADQLVLSERTVETHVSNIMLKLNFTSRRQIALWAVKKGLIANT